MPFILRSVMTKSAGLFLKMVSASLPDDVAQTLWPILRTTWATPSRIVSLSSIMRTLAMRECYHPRRVKEP